MGVADKNTRTPDLTSLMDEIRKLLGRKLNRVKKPETIDVMVQRVIQLKDELETEVDKLNQVAHSLEPFPSEMQSRIEIDHEIRSVEAMERQLQRMKDDLNKHLEVLGKRHCDIRFEQWRKASEDPG